MTEPDAKTTLRQQGLRDEQGGRELPLAVLRSLASPLRDLELRSAGRTFLLSLAVGTAVGVIACAFFVSLHFAERLLLHDLAGYTPLLPLGEATLLGTIPARTLLPGVLVVVLTAGGLVTGLLGHYLAPEVLGGGGNSYIEAVHGKLDLRRRVLSLKMLASISTLGTGGSGGREGPTMLIGAAVGNLVGRLLRIAARDRRMLLVAGAAGGLAAMFGTPLGAGLLASEVVYRDDFETDAVAPAVLSSVAAFSVFRLTFPAEGHLFVVASHYPFDPYHLWLYVPLTLFVLLGGKLFVAMLSATRHAFDRAWLPRWLRPALGGFALAVLALVWIHSVNPFLGLSSRGIGILGSGYGVAQAAIVSPAWMPGGYGAVALLGALAIVKMFATALTLESGGSAGDFGPSMAIGALLGGTFGQAVQQVLPGAPDPGSFALVGMGAFYGGLAHVPLAAVVMVCEMAGSYDLLVPLLLSVGLSYLALRRTSLYPAQPQSRAAVAATLNRLDGVRVSDLQLASSVVSVGTFARPSEIAEALEASHDGAVVVVDRRGRAVGVIDRRATIDLDQTPELALVVVAADISTPIVGIAPQEQLATALARMVEADLRILPVVDGHGCPVQVVTDHDVARAYYDAVAGERTTPPPEAQPPV